MYRNVRAERERFTANRSEEAVRFERVEMVRLRFSLLPAVHESESNLVVVEAFQFVPTLRDRRRVGGAALKEPARLDDRFDVVIDGDIDCLLEGTVEVLDALFSSHVPPAESRAPDVEQVRLGPFSRL